MPLTKMLITVGNSLGVILDKPILRMLGWDENTWIVMRAKGDTVVVRACTPEEAKAAAKEDIPAPPDAPGETPR